MANRQNNMRYGRQMNFNGTCRTMPGNEQACQRSTPEPSKPKPNDCRTPEPREPQCETPRCGAQKPKCPPHNELQDLPIAMAYVPWQRWQNLCEPCKALQRGTIFEDLIKPFHGRGGCNR